MDEISNEFENWPDQIINLKNYIPGLKKKHLFDCLQHNSFSFLPETCR